MITDLVFLVGINAAVRFHSKRGTTPYYYCFDYRGSTSFSNLFMNSTADFGEWLQFLERV